MDNTKITGTKKIDERTSRRAHKDTTGTYAVKNKSEDTQIQTNHLAENVQFGLGEPPSAASCATSAAFTGIAPASSAASFTRNSSVSGRQSFKATTKRSVFIPFPAALTAALAHRPLKPSAEEATTHRDVGNSPFTSRILANRSRPMIVDNSLNASNPTIDNQPTVGNNSGIHPALIALGQQLAAITASLPPDPEAEAIGTRLAREQGIMFKAGPPKLGPRIGDVVEGDGDEIRDVAPEPPIELEGGGAWYKSVTWVPSGKPMVSCFFGRVMTQEEYEAGIRAYRMDEGVEDLYDEYLL